MFSKAFYCLLIAFFIGHIQCQFDEFDFERAERERLDRERLDRERVRDQTVEECREKVMDIFFVLDSSSSIYINDYRSQHQFVREVVSRLDVNQVATRVGVLTFSDDYQRPVLGLNRYQTKSDVLSSINDQNLPYRTGITNTDQAIRYVRELSEFREDITKVIVVITDGGSRSPGSTARESELARENGFYLFVVGIGQYLEEREWRSIASDPDESFIYNITNFRYLDNVKFSLPARACGLPPLIVGSCNVYESSDIHFVAAPGGSQDALILIEEFLGRTRSPADMLRLSFYIENCANAENVEPSEDLGDYCDRFALRGEATTNTYVDLLARMRENARNNARSRNQVAVLFIDDETLRLNRFQVITEARNAEREGIEIVVVDLATRDFNNAAASMVSNRDNIVRFQLGPVLQQRQVQRVMISRICANINEYESRQPTDTRPIEPIVSK